MKMTRKVVTLYPKTSCKIRLIFYLISTRLNQCKQIVSLFESKLQIIFKNENAIYFEMKHISGMIPSLNGIDDDVAVFVNDYANALGFCHDSAAANDDDLVVNLGVFPSHHQVLHVDDHQTVSA